MRKPITEEQVEKAYEAVGGCLRSVEAMLPFIAGLQGKYPLDRGHEAIVLSPEHHEAMVKHFRGIRAVVKEAEPLIAPLVRDLAALHAEPVRSTRFVAPSYAEVVVMMGSGYGRLLEEWEEFGRLDTERQHWMFNECFGIMPNVPELGSRLRMEEAKLVERARSMAPAVRYAYEFLNLKGQSRRLFRFLAENPGRRLSTADIGEAVMDDADASPGSVHTAISRLKAALIGFGSAELAGCITEEDGDYRFK